MNAFVISPFVAHVVILILSGLVGAMFGYGAGQDRQDAADAADREAETPRQWVKS